MKKIAIVIIILIAAVAVFLALRQSDSQQPSLQDNQGDTSQQSETPAAVEAEEAIVIVYTDTGFETSDYAVQAGGTVTVRNDSNGLLAFSSDDHPVHTDNPELNIPDLASGESGQFIPTRSGSWGFHNHEQAAHTGVLTVQ